MSTSEFFRTDMSSKDPKVALIQLYPEPLALEANFERAKAYITEAAKEGCDIAALPEYALSLPIPEKTDEWVDAGKYWVGKYQELAKELKINIVPGTIVEKHGEGTGSESLYNIAYFIGRDGEIKGDYHKKNLWHPERDYLSKGEGQHQVIDTEFGKVGLLICWDLAFPEAFRALVKQGVKLIIAPTCWTYNDAGTNGLQRNPDSEAVFLDSTLTTRAFENGVAVVFVNAAGPKGDGWLGHSRVTLPFIGPLVKTEDNEECMLTVEIPMEVLDEAEEVYKVRKDLADPDFHY